MTNTTDTNLEDLKNSIEKIWNTKENISSSTKGMERDAIEECLSLLDSGKVRVSEKIEGNWEVNEWLKKAVLLSFKLWPMDIISGGPGNGNWCSNRGNYFFRINNSFSKTKRNNDRFARNL